MAAQVAATRMGIDSASPVEQNRSRKDDLGCGPGQHGTENPGA